MNRTFAIAISVNMCRCINIISDWGVSGRPSHLCFKGFLLGEESRGLSCPLDFQWWSSWEHRRMNTSCHTSKTWLPARIRRAGESSSHLMQTETRRCTRISNSQTDSWQLESSVSDLLIFELNRKPYYKRKCLHRCGQHKATSCGTFVTSAETEKWEFIGS